MEIFKAFVSAWRVEEFPKYPRIKRKDFKKWNERMFRKYNNERVYHHPNPIIRFIERRRIEVLLDEMSPLKRSHYILAAGCGEGYIEKNLEVGHLTLVDLSEEAVNRAKRTLKGRENVKFLVADLEKLPFHDHTFDKIECSEVIEHVFSPEKMMTELKRVLKRGGILVMTFPNEPLINFIKKIFIRLGMFTLFFPGVPKDMTEEWHLRSFDLNRFKEIANSEWRLVSVKTVPYSFLPIRYVIKCKKRR